MAGPSPMSAWRNTTRSPSSTSARFGRFPAYVSRSTATMRSSGWAARQWRTKFEPMKPAAPVTRIVDIGAVYGAGTDSPVVAGPAPADRRRGPRRPQQAGAAPAAGFWPLAVVLEVLATVVVVVEGAVDRLALAVDAPPVAADDEHHVDVLHRRVLDQLADATQVAGDELGLGQRARGVAHQRLRRRRARCRPSRVRSPRSWSSASVLPASPALPEPLSTLTTVSASWAAGGLGRVAAEGPQPREELVGLGLLRRRADRAGTSTRRSAASASRARPPASGRRCGTSSPAGGCCPCSAGRRS